MQVQDDFSKANIDNRDSSGDTALLRAARENDTDAILELLGRGANPVLADREGNTPLLMATRSQNIAVVEALIAAHADVTAENRHGETPIDAAIRTGNAYLVSIFEQPLRAILGGIPDAEGSSARYSVRAVGDAVADRSTSEGTISVLAPLGQSLSQNCIADTFSNAGKRGVQATPVPRSTPTELTAHEMRALFSKQ